MAWTSHTEPPAPPCVVIAPRRSPVRVRLAPSHKVTTNGTAAADAAASSSDCGATYVLVNRLLQNGVDLDPAAGRPLPATTERGWVRLIAGEESLTRRRSDRDLVALGMPACGCLDRRGGDRVIGCGATRGCGPSGRASRPRGVPRADRRDLRADVGARSTALPTQSRLRC
jgi:hypothetical protein